MEMQLKYIEILYHPPSKQGQFPLRTNVHIKLQNRSMQLQTEKT